MSYSPCASRCPPETCDNTAIYKRLLLACKDEVCTEGCAPDPCARNGIRQVKENL